MVRLEDFLERSDTLLVSGLRTRYSLSVEGEMIDETLVEPMSCSGTRCVAGDGTEITVRSLIEPAATADELDVALGSRDGFDTVSASGDFEISEMLSGVTVSASPDVDSYGFWGEHGFAAVQIGSGALTVRIDGTPYTGNFDTASAYALGDASGTNPGGTGSARWTGIAEAVAIGGFVRRLGTATVTIADLSQPRVGVAIEVSGQSIGAPGWADMPLTAGGFSAGTTGSDYLSGNFHGDDHQEAWGLFDTADHIGAFGATREQ